MGDLAPAEQETVSRAAAEPMLDQVLAWSAVNSGSRNLAGLDQMAGLLSDAFAALPGEPGFEVSAPDHAFQETRWLEDGVLNGPGVADMKGGIAVMLAALKAVEASPAAGQLGYEVVINSDEEVGSLSSAALLARAAQGKAAALTYEPAALPDGTLAGARPGSGNFALIVRGRSAHAGRNPEDGRNALLAAADLALKLAAAKGPGLSINPSRIEGGSPSNVVPDLAVLRVNLRPRTPEDEQRA